MRVEKVLAAMAANINRDPSSYDDTAADIRALASKHGIDAASIALPPRQAGLAAAPQGLLGTGQPQSPMLAVNCAQAGVRDCAQAARLAQALLPVLTIQ